ncbi:hypothetical protein Pelo_15520 [Pelomyxa schiedti]|nr:hypothetical protein Pelo_15520 [Pelomyxa schiedti]
MQDEATIRVIVHDRGSNARESGRHHDVTCGSTTTLGDIKKIATTAMRLTEGSNAHQSHNHICQNQLDDNHGGPVKVVLPRGEDDSTWFGSHNVVSYPHDDAPASSFCRHWMGGALEIHIMGTPCHSVSAISSTCPCTVSLSTTNSEKSSLPPIENSGRIAVDCTPSLFAPPITRHHDGLPVIEFWKCVFPDHEEVHWDAFADRFHSFFGASVLTLAAKICGNVNQKVSISQWEKLARYWSDLNGTILDKESISMWTETEGFCGFMSMEESEVELGQFPSQSLLLLRCSENLPRMYSVDIQTSDGSMRHHRIGRAFTRNLSQWFTLNESECDRTYEVGNEFGSIQDIIQAFRDKYPGTRTHRPGYVSAWPPPSTHE